MFLVSYHGSFKLSSTDYTILIFQTFVNDTETFDAGRVHLNAKDSTIIQFSVTSLVSLKQGQHIDVRVIEEPPKTSGLSLVVLTMFLNLTQID